MSRNSTAEVPPFHRLLAFYSNRSPYPDTQTIRLHDSLTGNLALGLDFPVALAVAVGRHITLRNTSSFFSFDIHIPSVTRSLTPLEGLPIDEKTSYSRSDFLSLARNNVANATAMGGGGGVVTSALLQVEAMGLWSLAADVNTGKISGEDVVAFQKGTLFQTLERRRRDRSQVLPLWRGGPISVAGHSWLVGRVFGVRVYLDEEEGRRD